MLQRAADSLESIYSFPRGQGGTGPLNHIGPAIYANYPRSPALFTPILTGPGFTTATKWNPVATGAIISPTKIGGYNSIPSDGIRKMPGEGSSTGAVSRSSSDETLSVQTQGQEHGQTVDHNPNSASFFNFPLMHDSMSHTEIKHELQNTSEIHKPKPITPGPHLYPVAMPFVQVASMHGQGPPYTSYSMTPYNEPSSFMNVHASAIDGSNRNNNNNATFATYAAGLGNHMMAVNPVFIPPSPGFFMAPTGILINAVLV